MRGVSGGRVKADVFVTLSEARSLGVGPGPTPDSSLGSE
jgi:hypothetical protein